MYHSIWLMTIPLLLCAVWAHAGEPASTSPAAQPPCMRVLLVRNESGRTTTITPAEFAKLPQATVRDKIPHTDQDGAYEGVLLHELLRAAGVAFADPAAPDKKLPASLRTAYVLVEASDGYQVVFSIPEIHPDLGGREVLLVNRVNGVPLDAKLAPYQVIVPGSDLHARWIRQVTRIMVQPATAAPVSPQDAAATAPQTGRPSEGQVFLVGTGPGDPELMSVKAAQLLKRADIVFCYSWMKDEVAPFVRPGAVEVASPLLMGGQYCGQNPDDFQGELQERVRQTNEALDQLKTRIRAAVADGKTVAFADNGDPTIFSPWGWVPDLLAEFRPVVIPGMSSFNAANAVLQRGLAGQRSLILSSGSDLGRPDPQGRLSSTLVFFTQRVEIQKLMGQLRDRYPADTPVAIVCDVSYPSERILRGQLGTFADVVAKEQLPLLYLLYVGDALGVATAAK
ncbi:MAG: molybdopterin-dependent oxidoreductase [Pirellulaceae bacterium]|nr:molybdopterin-dependent oxidoreductase [Pirellulaceae bacterium]